MCAAGALLLLQARCGCICILPPCKPTQVLQARSAFQKGMLSLLLELTEGTMTFCS